jgi:hypothetical protein
MRTLPFRPLHIHPRFTPEGSDDRGRKVFIEFWMAAMERIQRNRAQELARERRKSKQLEVALDKLSPIILAALGGNEPIEAASADVQDLVPDAELRRKVFDLYAEWLKDNPEDLEQKRKELALDRSDVCRGEKLLKARATIQRGLMQLFEAVRNADAEAAEDLVEVAKLAAVLLSSAEKAQPELFKPIARWRTDWPVLAKHEASWEKAALQHIAELDLGAGLQVFHVRFRTVRGADANLPARRWAKAAVRVAEETKWRCVLFGGLIRDFGSSNAFADFFVGSGWEFGNEPAWVNSVMKLKRFSKESLAEWKPVVKEIIRDQVPDFHALPVWTTQRNTAAANGKTAKGEVQNAILDDIVSALERLAPDPAC